MRPADPSGARVSRMTGTALCWVRRTCIAPSIHSPESYVRGACVPVPPTDVRAITQGLPPCVPGARGGGTCPHRYVPHMLT